MKINKEITQLNLDKSLLVVMGSHHGIIYKMEGGELNQIDEHRVDTPVYSDNEGMFQRGGGDNPSYGSVLEPKKEKAQEDFSKEFIQKIEDACVSDSVESIYLFAPSECNSLIESDWSNILKTYIKERFEGNYTPKEPSELIDMVGERVSQKNKKEPTGEAKEILEKTEHLQ